MNTNGGDKHLHTINPELMMDVSDGRDTWWSDYKESDAVNNERISLKADLNYKWFTEAMNTLRENQLQLTEYDAKLFRDLEDGLDMFGRDLKPTRKQFNHIRQVAFDFAKGA